MGRERGHPIFEPDGFGRPRSAPVARGTEQPAPGRGRETPNNLLAFRGSQSFQRRLPKRKQMQMSPKTPHKALQTEAASSASIALYSQPNVLRVKGKGPYAFFHVGWKGVCVGGGGLDRA